MTWWKSSVYSVEQGLCTLGSSVQWAHLCTLGPNVHIQSPLMYKECTDAYEHTYETMEDGVFQLVGSTIRCNPPWGSCSAIHEQVEQQLMRAELEPQKKKGQPAQEKKKLSLPLLICSTTTRQNFRSSYTRKSSIWWRRSTSAQCISQVKICTIHLHN